LPGYAPASYGGAQTSAPHAVPAAQRPGHRLPAATPSNGFAIAGGIFLLLAGVVSLAGWGEVYFRILENWEIFGNGETALSLVSLGTILVLSVGFGIFSLGRSRRAALPFVVALALFLFRLLLTFLKGDSLSWLRGGHIWSFEVWQASAISGGLICTGISSLLLLVAVSKSQGARS
jgi:hypothetical protein